MKLEELRAPEGSTRARKRRGRGNATGQGKTGGRGMNGQKQRSGGKVRLGFEGGQMPLARRLPKRGFDNNWKKVYSVVNVSSFEVFEENTVITAELLLAAGILSKIEPYGLKVLGDGEITKAITVKAAKFSKSAIEKIEKIGGKVEVL